MALPQDIVAIIQPGMQIHPQVPFVPVIPQNPIMNPQLSPWRHSITTSVKNAKWGTVWTVTATSNISSNQAHIVYYWYIDGEFTAQTNRPVFTFFLQANAEVIIDVYDTTSKLFDPSSYNVNRFPRHKTIYWTRTRETDVDKYMIRQKKSGGSWVILGYVEHDEDLWDYIFVTDKLDDLSAYEFDVTPYDFAGNAGTAVSIASEIVVGTPDGPDWEKEYNTTPDTVTFSSV